MSDVLVIGATGQQGGAVARHLLAAGTGVRALVRDTSKDTAKELERAGATLVRGDLDDRDSLGPAFDGVEAVFNMQNGYPPNGTDGEVRQGRNVAEAAATAGVRQVVHSSVGGAERDSGVPHFASKYEVEKLFAEYGVPTTVVRPVFFMENFGSFLSPRLAGDEVVVRMAITPRTPLQLIAVDDIGRIVAGMLADPRQYLGRSLEIAGDELTGTGLAEVFGAATGLPTRFEQQPLDEVRAFSEDTALMFDWFQKAGYQADIDALRRRFPGLTSLADWLRAVDWKPSAGWGH